MVKKGYRARRKKSSSKNKKESRRCFKCGSKDHLVVQCPYNSDNDDDDKKRKKKDKNDKKEKKDEKKDEKKKSMTFKATSSKGKAKQESSSEDEDSSFDELDNEKMALFVKRFVKFMVKKGYRARRKKSSSKNKDETMRCFKCGSKDHRVAQCPYNSDNSDDNKKNKKKDKKKKKEKKDKMTFKKKKVVHMWSLGIVMLRQVVMILVTMTRPLRRRHLQALLSMRRGFFLLMLISFVNKGIFLWLSCPHTSQQNGKDEHAIRTILWCFHTLQFYANMPTSFWVEALARVPS